MMMARIALWAVTLPERAKKEEGQTLVEYGLLLVLIAVLCIGILTALGKSVSTVFVDINNAF